MRLLDRRFTTYQLTLPEDLVLLLLNEENGYFHQVPGWDLNCAVAGAVLAELSIQNRIDTDLDSLFLVDPTVTGHPALDPILEEIAKESAQHNTQYWIERLAHLAESVIDSTLDRLVDLRILDRHEGDFYTLTRSSAPGNVFDNSMDGSRLQSVKTRISNAIFENEIPDPRDALLISLVNTCDVFRFMFQLDEAAEDRIRLICRMALIGRSIAAAVSQNMANPLLRRSAFTKKDPEGSAAQGNAQPPPSERKRFRPLRGPDEGIRAGVWDQPPIQGANDCPVGTGDQQLGAPPRTHVPEIQGLFF